MQRDYCSFHHPRRPHSTFQPLALSPPRPTSLCFFLTCEYFGSGSCTRGSERGVSCVVLAAADKLVRTQERIHHTAHPTSLHAASVVARIF
jgi:hypothetical protein